jgi:cell cycle sensor histidine kinase DivJ
MASEGSKRLDWTFGAAGALMPDASLRLFRECRLVSAIAILAVFPAIALTSDGALAVLASLLLFGILPAAIALDVRHARLLPRALMMSLVAAAAVLLGGVLRGLPPVPANALLAVLAIEAAVLGGARVRLAAITIVTAMLAATTIAGLMQSFGVTGGFLAEPMPNVTVTIAIVLVINVMLLARGMAQGVATERRGAREQRLQGREIEAMVSETVVAADGSGAVIRVSDNATRVLGLPSEALKGRGLTELILVADRPLFLTALADCVHSASQKTLRVRLRTSTSDEAPRYRWVEITWKPSDEDRTVALATLRDIDCLVASEDLARKAASEAEAAKTARASFLTTVNHELRTPLNAIIGFSEFLANPATTPQNTDRLQEYASIINGAGQDLLRIVTAMIDITRIDSGVYEFEPEAANVVAIVQAAVECFQSEPEAKNAKIRVETSDDYLDAHVDQRALRCVLHQVLSNAVKFGGNSRPVTVRISADDASIEVSVTDFGPGISQEKLALLGSHFARLDEGLTRERGGIGLGLSLARGLMALHRGRMAITSSPGQGTTVRLSLARLGAADLAPPSNILPLQRNPSPQALPKTDHATQRRIA